jgi:hypothetical protein
VCAARELTGVGRISWPGLRWGGGRGFADERSRARGAATTTSRMRRRKRSRGRERGGRWIRGRSAARRWTSSIPTPSTSGSPASESERPARHGPYEESGYTRRGVRAARELTMVGRISWPGLRWGGGRGFADERSRARGAATATSRVRRRKRSRGRERGGAGSAGGPPRGDGRAASRRPARATRRPPSPSDLRGTGHTRKAVTLGEVCARRESSPGSAARCARGERAHRGRSDLLAGTAVGRGKRVRRRTEPGARCCYDDVEDEDEDEEPRRGGRERWIRGRAVNRGGGGGARVSRRGQSTLCS